MAEKWTVSADGKTATVSGRTPIPLSKKINPLWWFGNDTEQTVDQAKWFMSGKPEWLRWLCWQVRNPLQNFRAFVAGVQDRNYTVIGRAPVLTVQRNDLPPPINEGFQWCVIHLAIPLPFVSYSGSTFVWYFGWQPTGFFGVKFNIKW